MRCYLKRTTVNVFKALSDPNRIRIVKMLEGKELCVCEVREVLDLSSSTVSKHLSILRDAGLILDAKDGKWVNYCLNDDSRNTFVRSQLELVRKSFADDEQLIADRKKLLKVDRTVICKV
jgi:ArsR family transcriptional regulator, arsenate/arsenite/antimonite-responsive transcriptional repressor